MPYIGWCGKRHPCQSSYLGLAYLPPGTMIPSLKGGCLSHHHMASRMVNCQTRQAEKLRRWGVAKDKYDMADPLGGWCVESRETIPRKKRLGILESAECWAHGSQMTCMARGWAIRQFPWSTWSWVILGLALFSFPPEAWPLRQDRRKEISPANVNWKLGPRGVLDYMNSHLVRVGVGLYDTCLTQFGHRGLARRPQQDK